MNIFDDPRFISRTDEEFIKDAQKVDEEVNKIMAEAFEITIPIHPKAIGLRIYY